MFCTGAPVEARKKLAVTGCYELEDTSVSEKYDVAQVWSIIAVFPVCTHSVCFMRSTS